MKVRFTIRDLLWLTVVVALAVGWWLHSTRLSRSLATSQAMEAQTNDYLAQIWKQHEELRQQIANTASQRQTDHVLLRNRQQHTDTTQTRGRLTPLSPPK